MKKKVLVVLIAILFLLCYAIAPVIAQDRGVQVTFEWDQADSGDPGFWGWRMYAGTTAGGPYDYLGMDANNKAIPLVVVQYDPANPQGPFTGVGDITAPDNAETTFYFVVVAYDDQGNFSGNSNEVDYTADFVGPGEPVLRITATVIITPPSP
jgi:hypothetical protein